MSRIIGTDEPNLLLLGPLRVVAADGIRAVTGHAGRLLVELVVADDVVPRGRLTDALWGDAPPASADAALRVHLTRLRRLVDGTPLRLERRGSSLELTGAITDLDVFERGVGRARSLRLGEPTWDELDAAASTLARCCELWRGPPFAPYEGGTLAAVSTRAFALRAAAEELAFDIDLDRGRHRLLIPDLERAVSDEPFREGAWARLMLARYRDGRQRDALAAFAAVRTMLVDQLGVEPGPGLQRMQRRILDQDPDLDWTPPDGAPAPPGRRSTVGAEPAAPGATHRRTDRADALIGRDKEFAAVVDALDEHRLVTVSGSPGIGKSALARAVVESSSGATVVVDLERVSTPALLASEVAEALGLGPDPSDGVDALPLVVAALSDREVVVVLDGGDRLGDTVTELAATLIARCPTVRVLAARRSPLDLGSEELIELGLLEPADSTALLVQLLDDSGRGEPSAFEPSLERIAVATNGHPLSLQLAAGWIDLLGADTVAAQLESGELPIATDPDEPFVDRVEVSLRSVDARSRRAFVALAAFRSTFDADAVARVASVSPRDASRVLRDLRRATLIQPATEPGRWFLLAAIRDAAWELADRDGTRQAIVAAHETFLLDTVEPWRIGRYGFDAPAVRAAIDPWRADLHELFVRRVAARDLDAVPDLIDGLYWYWEASSRRPEAAPLLELALAMGEAQPDHAELGLIRSLHASIGGTFTWQADHLAEATQALDECEHRQHRLGMFSAHLALAMGHGWKGDLASAERHLAEAGELADAAPPYFRPSPMSYLGIVRLAAGDPTEASRLLERAIDAYDEMGSSWGVAHCLSFIGMAALFTGDHERAESVFHQTIERAVESGNRHSELHARMGLADLLDESGGERDASAEYEQIVADLLEIGDLGCAGQCVCAWGERSRASGDDASTRWLLLEAAGIGRRARDPGVVTRAVTGLAEMAIDRHDRVEAERLLRGLEALSDDVLAGGRPVRPIDQARLGRCLEVLADAGSDIAGRRPDPGDDDLAPVQERGLWAVLTGLRSDARRSDPSLVAVSATFGRGAAGRRR